MRSRAVPDHLHFEQWVPFPVEQVFLFFSNPGNLPRIMPPATKTEVLNANLVPPPGVEEGRATLAQQLPLAGAGSELITSFRVVPFLPFRAKWIAVITEFEWNHHFADVQKKGPFKNFQHWHEFSAETRDRIQGTCVRDIIQYDVGFGWLGRTAEATLVRRQLQSIFAYRQAALERLLGQSTNAL